MKRLAVLLILFVAGCSDNQAKPGSYPVNVGDVVILRSGSYLMTVETIEGDDATVVFWERYPSSAEKAPELIRWKVKVDTLKRS